MSNSDIVEITLYDYTYTKYLKLKARLDDKQEIKELNDNLKTKGVTLVKIKQIKEWF